MKGHVYCMVAIVLIVLVLLTGLRAGGMFRLGVENMPWQLIRSLQSQSVGVISNQRARDQKGRRTIDVLLSYGINVQKIFEPEYGGICSSFLTEELLESVDTVTGIPVMALYTKDALRSVISQMVDDVDVLLFDVQGGGMRHHSHLATMVHMMQVAQQYNKLFIVLDRPNPLGAIMEGALVDYSKKSYISALPIPARHGLTIGEIAWYCNMHILKCPAHLIIVKMANYDRSRSILSAHYAVPSCIDTSLGYDFLGLLREVSPFHIGCFADNLSSAIMLPDSLGVSCSGWLALCRAFEALSVHSEYAQRNYNDIAYSGLKIHIHDINQVPLFRLLMSVFDFCKDHGVTLSFSDRFDYVAGTSLVRNVLQETFSVHALIQKMHDGLTQFYTAARSSFMYQPLPQIYELGV